jgi:glycosyltransferase involved in cell wall biosynthesis
MGRARRRVLQALLFFPRGGSAHVAANLAAALPGAGWDGTVLSGSVSLPGRPGDARAFYAGCDVHIVDMTEALGAPDPVTARPVPLHPSYEDRPDAPDRVMASLDDAAYAHQVATWRRALAEAGAEQADVLHLHHLTPIHAAAAEVAPDVPVVTHLHGTELLMLEDVAAGAPWPHGAAWARRLREWAQKSARLLLLSTTQIERAVALLDVDPRRCTVVPNGFDPAIFAPRPLDRRAHWRRHLVDAPQGWRPGEAPGSIAYTDADLAPLEAPGAPVLLYVGRFTAVKRVGLLIEAYAHARASLPAPVAPLVLVGGFPGEWEGEHPWQTLERLGGVDGVFLAGWHGHDALADFLCAADVLVLPSVREQFGQVLVEAMACGRPVVAVDAFGPREIVRDPETGWLVAPDDRDGLAAALLEAAGDPAERARRGAAALQDARARYAWPALAGRVSAVYDAARR